MREVLVERVTTWSLFNQKTGTKFAYIPYKGSGDSVNAVVAGQVTMTISDPAPIMGPIRGGTIRPIAITGSKRHPTLPDVPTFGELGIPAMDISIWTGFEVPAATPMPIVRRLQNEIARAVRTKEVIGAFRRHGPRSGRQHLRGVRQDHRGRRPALDRGCQGRQHQVGLMIGAVREDYGLLPDMRLH